MKSRPCWRFIVSVNDNVFPAYIALGKIALEGKLAVIRQFGSGGQGKFYSRRGIVVVRREFQNLVAAGQGVLCNYCRSEERRVGKECSARWARWRCKSRLVRQVV